MQGDGNRMDGKEGKSGLVEEVRQTALVRDGGWLVFKMKREV